MDDLRIKIGSRIKEFRNQKRFTQEELAHYASMSSAHLGKIERGELNFTVGSLEKILSALTVTTTEFFSFEDEVLHPASPYIDKTIRCMESMTLEEQKTICKIASLFYRRQDERE